jgi:hypothetical protein
MKLPSRSLPFADFAPYASPVRAERNTLEGLSSLQNGGPLLAGMLSGSG